jgi:ABC-type branched-subunit amino acid transport system permease subunit
VRLATLFAFVVSGAIAGLAGALIAHGDESVSASAWNFGLSLFFVTMTVVGGLRSRAGLVIGGAFFALLPDPGRRSRVRICSPRPRPGRPDPAAAPIIGPLLLLINVIGSGDRPAVRPISGDDRAPIRPHDRGLKEVITDVVLG